MPKLKVLPENPFSWIVCFLLAAGLMTVFHPGLYSLDSIFMVMESVTGFRNDNHSLLMPFALSMFYQIGIPSAMVVFLQLLAGFFGLRKLMLSLLSFLGGMEAGADRSASFLLLVLASPLTPVSTYFVTLWNDTWLSVFMIWMVAFLLDLYSENLTEPPFALRTVAVLLLLTLAMLTRHNAISLFPFVMLALGLLFHRRSLHWKYYLVAVLSPLVIYGSFLYYQYDVLHILRVHPENPVYALDMASMIVEDPEICHNLSIRSCDLVVGVFPAGFQPGTGAIDYSYNQGREIFQPFDNLVQLPQLPAEFFATARQHPFLLARVDLLNFMDYIHPDSTRYFYSKGILPNDLGLSLDGRFAAEQEAWFRALDWVLQNHVVRWFSFVHAVWLSVNIVGLLICLALAIRSDRERYLFLGSLLLIPFSYYGSYLLALTTSEFRFMFPSMLVVQVFFMVVIAVVAVKRLGRRAMR